MAKEADAHSAEDKARREEIDAKNQLDSMVYNIEKMLKEQGDKISGSDRGDVENAMADAKKAHRRRRQGGDGQGAREADGGFAQTGGADVQSGAGGRRARTGAGPADGPAPGANGAGQKKDEGVIDAEYVDVEEKK